MACQSCGGSKTTQNMGSRSACSCATGSTPQWPCTQGFDGGLERTRFFDGMVLTQSDLFTEQAFWRSKRKLTNRALGEGVVWGLRADWDARSQSFSVGPGYAIDCCGEDLVVTECQVVSSRSLVDRSNSVIQGILASAKRGENAKAYLALKYSEALEDPRDVSAQGCAPSGGTRREPARVRETAALCLVPVPDPQAPGPTTRFLEDFKALIDSVDPTLAEELQPDGGEGAPPFTVHVRRDGEARVLTPFWDPARESWVLEGEPLAFVSGLEANEKLVVEVRAAQGWVLSEGELGLTRVGFNEESSEQRAQVEAPWQLQLIRSLELPPSTQTDEGLVLSSLQGGFVLSRLFSDRRVRVGRMSVQLELRTGGPEGEQQPQIQVSVRAQGQIEGSEEPEAALSACPGFGPEIFFAQDASGGSDLRPLVLGALYAWFGSALKRDGKQDIWDGDRISASWILLVAWRFLFGVDAALPDGKPDTRVELAKLLQLLVQRWCQGLHYAGPRCGSEHQAVPLGTVTLSGSGRVLGLDMWAGRRQVLTGPLLNHWMGQLGLASLDEVVSRVASALCCVGGLDLQALPPLPSANKNGLRFEKGAVAFSGNAGALVGDEAAVAKHLVAMRLQVVARREVGHLEFLRLSAQALTELGQDGTLCTLVQIRGQGGRRHHLVLPASVEERAEHLAKEARLRESIRAGLLELKAEDDIGVLGMQALEDLALVLIRDMPLPGEGAAAAVGPFGLLERHGDASLGGALALGPEGLWGRLDALGLALSAPEFNKLWALLAKRQMQVLQGTIKAVVGVVGVGAFERSSLAHPALPAGLVTVFGAGGGPWVILPDAEDACSEAFELGG